MPFYHMRKKKICANLSSYCNKKNYKVIKKQKLYIELNITHWKEFMLYRIKIFRLECLFYVFFHLETYYGVFLRCKTSGVKSGASNKSTFGNIDVCRVPLRPHKPVIGLLYLNVLNIILLWKNQGN